MIYIGVCKPQEPSTLGELKDTYGLLLPETKKFHRLPKSGSYTMDSFGPGAKAGDVIGVLLEFTPSGAGEMTFFKNGGSMGKTYTDIKPGEYIPCVSINNGKNIVLLRSAKMPSEPYAEAKKGQDEQRNGGNESEE